MTTANSLKVRTSVRRIHGSCEAQGYSTVAKKTIGFIFPVSVVVALGGICSLGFAQSPVITPGGIVNAASHTQPVAPGSVISIFGTNLADAVYSARTTPLPTTLGNTSVFIDGFAAPLFYASPTQINAQVPGLIPNSSSSFLTANVVVTTKSGISSPVPVSTFYVGPGLYTVDSSGCGQATALNVAPDGSVSPNSPANSAAPGDIVLLFGNGFGATYGKVADGTATKVADATSDAGSFAIDAGPSRYRTQYLGLAPDQVGVYQANVQIPLGTRDGCAVPLAVSGENLFSPTVSLSIHSSRGQCIDPPTQSYGSIALVKTMTSGTAGASETETLNAWFPSGPQLVRPAVSLYDDPATFFAANSIEFPAPAQSCPVAGYTPLSAGQIVVNGPAGSITVGPSPATGPVTYSQSLPSGFLKAGSYSFFAGGSSGVGAFQGTMNIASPIKITAVNMPASYGGPLTVGWSGGSPESIVTVSVVDHTLAYETGLSGQTTAAAGSYALNQLCTGRPISAGGSGVACFFQFPGGGIVNEVVVEQTAPTGQIPVLQANGITSSIEAFWMYRFVIGIPPQ